MTSIPQTPQNGEQPKGTRFRASWGGLVIPVAIIGAISAVETARTSTASREVFFNISTPWLMYFVFALSMGIIIGAFVNRSRIWRLGRPHHVNRSLGARIAQALTLGAGTSRVKNDRFAGTLPTIH